MPLIVFDEFSDVIDYWSPQSRCMLVFFFFFQAEDGIRDHCVTGVQTCALPIYRAGAGRDNRWYRRAGLILVRPAAAGLRHRSEERRVGKECRFRWSPYLLNKEDRIY